MMACLTDYLDGYIARTYAQTTRLGKFLDPIADKILVISTLFLMGGQGHLSSLALIPALVIICREMMISALREFLSSYQQPILPVSSLAKWKTTFQMVALTLLFVRKEVPLWIGGIGEGFLWVAALLTVWTGAQYFRSIYTIFLR